MQKIQLSFLTPKYFDGCHRSGLSNYLPNPSFFQNVDVTSPFAFPQSEKSSPPISTGRLVLEGILDRISRTDLPGREHFIQYLHEKYRRNCRPNTIRLAATSLTQFLSFCCKEGKRHLEQMSREDIEMCLYKERQSC